MVPVRMHGSTGREAAESLSLLSRRSVHDVPNEPYSYRTSTAKGTSMAVNLDVVKAYSIEIAEGALGAVSLAGAAWLGAAAPEAGGGALAAGAVGAAALGALAGSLLRRRTDAEARAVLEARVGELEGRPAADEHQRALARAQKAEEERASAQEVLTSTSEELANARGVCEKLAAALEQAQVTASLDRFSDFQLLALCDICDAEDREGYLVRPFEDPAMEQLSALGAVTFASHPQGERQLQWTLVPEIRQAVRAQRVHIDERTQTLRARRGESAMESDAS